jgi:hypothetical protein
LPKCSPSIGQPTMLELPSQVKTACTSPAVEAKNHIRIDAVHVTAISSAFLATFEG